jgi:hypothetical protein
MISGVRRMTSQLLIRDVPEFFLKIIHNHLRMLETVFKQCFASLVRLVLYLVLFDVQVSQILINFLVSALCRLYYGKNSTTDKPTLIDNIQTGPLKFQPVWRRYIFVCYR